MKKVLCLVLLCVLALGLVGAAQAQERVRVGFANINETAYFGRAVHKSVEKEIEARGWELVFVDNNSDGATAVKNADYLISMDVDYVIEINVDSSVAPVIMEKFNSAGIPVIAVDIPHEGAVFFGIDNVLQGTMAGEAAADYINAHWDGQLDHVVLFTQAASGDFVAPRVTAFPQGLKNKGVQFDPKEVYEIEGQGDVQLIQQRFADFLTAHPDARHIAVTGISESAGTAIYAAAETAGRQNDIVLVSQGCSGEYVSTLYACQGDTNWYGTVAPFPERYGEWIAPIIEKMIAGEPLQEAYFLEPQVITWENVTKWYPLDNLPWAI